MSLSYMITGFYNIRLEASDFKRFWSICMHHGIDFRHVKMEAEHIYGCQIRRDCYDKLLDIAKKTQVSVEILKRSGLPYWFQWFKMHIWLLLGGVIALFLLFYLSGSVWNIQIEGNCYYGKEVILRYLKEKDIQCMKRLSDLSCASISSDLRMAFPRITWASCEIKGCDLIIHLKENVLQDRLTVHDNGAYDLVAGKDGIIDEIFVRKGIALVEDGQSVKKGDILISGYIPIENDAMEVIAYESVVSDGDVMISTEYAYFDEVDRRYTLHHVLEEVSLPYIKIGSSYIEGLYFNKAFLRKDEPLYRSQIINQKEFGITDTFILPFAWGEKRTLKYEIKEDFYSDSELKTLSDEHFYTFCINLEKKGVQICKNNVKMVLSNASVTRTGNVTVLEKTGELKRAKEPFLNSDNMEE